MYTKFDKGNRVTAKASHEVHAAEIDSILTVAEILYQPLSYIVINALSLAIISLYTILVILIPRFKNQHGSIDFFRP